MNEAYEKTWEIYIKKNIRNLISKENNKTGKQMCKSINI